MGARGGRKCECTIKVTLLNATRSSELPSFGQSHALKLGDRSPMSVRSQENAVASRVGQGRNLAITFETGVTLRLFRTISARSHRGTGVLGVLSLMLLVVAPAVAQPAPGEPDTTFGSNGVVSSSTGGTDSFGRGPDMALQTDGKIVVATGYTDESEGKSYFLVERYDADGTLDSSFGSGGIVKTGFGGSEATASSVLIEPGGKILGGSSRREVGIGSLQHRRHAGQLVRQPRSEHRGDLCSRTWAPCSNPAAWRCCRPERSFSAVGRRSAKSGRPAIPSPRATRSSPASTKTVHSIRRSEPMG